METELGDHCEWFQFSKGFCCEFDRSNHSIISLKMNGNEVRDDDILALIVLLLEKDIAVKKLQVPA